MSAKKSEKSDRQKWGGTSPAWAEELRSKFTLGMSFSFILSFNVSDYVLPGVSLRVYLAKMMASREIIIFYNQAEGFTFPLESHRQKFFQALGLEGERGIVKAKMAGLIDPKGPNKNDTGVCLELITRLLRMGAPGDKLACVVIEYAESIFPEGARGEDDRKNLVLAQTWGRDNQIAQSGNVVIMVTENEEDIAQPLRRASSRWENLTLPLPDYEARLNYTDWYLSGETGFTSTMSNHEIAAKTAFLQLVHVEEIFMRASEDGVLTPQTVQDRKSQIIKTEFGDQLEIWDTRPEDGFCTIGGLAEGKRFLTQNVINPLKNGKTHRIPKGILMMGPPGTGKSVLAKALACEAEINAGELNLSKIFDKYVGASEKNFERAVRAMLSLAPFLCFIDEIDQALSRGQAGDSGVNNHVFKRLLEIMSDENLRGKIIFVAATNRPDLLDAALKRAGRFDAKMACFVPEQDGRAEILQIMARQYFSQWNDTAFDSRLLEATEGWTGAELRDLARKAAEVAEDDELPPVEAFEAAIDRICPTTQGIAEATAISLAELSDIDLVPARYREQWRNIRKGITTTTTQQNEIDLQPIERTRREL